jgi:hypothetical protein
MRKIIPNLLLIGCSLSLAIIPSVSLAGKAVPGVDTFRENVAKSFLQKANDPKSAFHKKLAKFNQEHVDGRNSAGVLPKTLSSTNIQVIPILGEDTFGRYCDKIATKPQHLLCHTTVNETYLVVIPYKMSVHKAATYDSLKFVVKSIKRVEWKVDSQEKEYDRHESIKIDEPIEASLKAGSEQL